ncbi:hypothetical protein [Flavobacterium sp. LS1R10]|uniref:hypothetical protein n=1 Tax=Flavobacterium sp. LS1R10 TaxID=2497482 RepID=UPI000F832442|nr:hypothetical protein [Flavobacterium sp. LS1R10]RTY74578.1 hypothetical protein EKL96_07395 [Flavobacterium sp. LS1R10]
MKKYFTNLVIIMALSILFIGCSNEENEIKVETLDSSKDAKRIADIINSGTEGIPFPEGSKVFKKSEDNFEIRLPKDFYFLISELDSNGNSSHRAIAEISDVSVTCSCTKGSGCSPVKAQGEYYCVMNSGCTTCTTSTARIGTKQNIKILGIIDYNMGVSFVSESKSLLTSSKNKIISKSISEHFLNKTEVKKALLEFYSVIYDKNIPSFITENKNPPAGYSFSKVNLFGNEIMVPVKSNSFSTELGISEIDDAAVTCSCSSGSGCVKKSFMGAKYCDAGSCTKCTLND